MKLSSLATFCTVSLLILSGCNGIEPKPQAKTIIDSTLPMVKLTNNGTISAMKSIAFEWNSVADSRVKGIYVYKSTSLPEKRDKKSDDYYKTIDSRFTTHYLDKNIKPGTQYRYYFRTFSKNAQSKKSRLIVVDSLPILDSVSWIYAETNMPRSAKIIWRPHSNKLVKSYIIERKTLKNDEWDEIARLDGRLNAEYIDTNLDDNHVYKYRIRVFTYNDIVSKPSKIVTIVTKPLPEEIENIRATSTLPREIKVTWSPSKLKDFDRYYVYRSDRANGGYELVAKLYNNRFIDKIDEDGKQFFYRVSQVDKDGLESKNDKYSIQGITLVKPNAPDITEVRLQGNDKIIIKWSKTDPRTKTFTLSRRYKKGWFDEVKNSYKGLRKDIFIDKNIKPNSTYFYKVFAVDKNGIESNPSMEVKIVTPESNKIIKPKNIKTQERVAVPTSKTNIKSEDIIVPTDDLEVNEN